MSRNSILALLALLMVTPALAQDVQVRKLDRALPVKIVPQVQELQAVPNDFAEKIMTIEEAKAQMAKLRAERRELNSKLAEAANTIQQMTVKGGSLVHAYCASDEISRNTAGAEENCGAAGYACAEVSGLCKNSCTIGPDCAAGFTCDVGKCVNSNKYADPS